MLKFFLLLVGMMKRNRRKNLRKLFLFFSPTCIREIREISLPLPPSVEKEKKKGDKKKRRKEKQVIREKNKKKLEGRQT